MLEFGVATVVCVARRNAYILYPLVQNSKRTQPAKAALQEAISLVTGTVHAHKNLTMINHAALIITFLHFGARLAQGFYLPGVSPHSFKEGQE